ncbi:hypothetical protein DICPUDRAFT_98383 [Dictyostelium purpureum]|uniref:F-box domain-containing protein n=1 Tax=Dictyostelium purpureum TaxID=5786 RepID=F0ZQ03_DICPU|nr:uncharacterized protein DICPUDRAFT_98383 [Dictyostelium purpureum]EGC33977.1 hypothetical protein DICPUDRAFT_98383 [Dictyostelium purpureum]|eukprot:XP_003289510.1 hypothetical protein DICPUDRAFT_98383 [Dictyostelium purpureum]
MDIKRLRENNFTKNSSINSSKKIKITNFNNNNINNNSNNNNNVIINNTTNINITKPILPIYLQKIIIKLLCNKIDEYNKAYINYYINDELVEMDNIQKYEIQSLALVNWCWFNCFRENLTVSHDFLSYHYYPSLYDLEGEINKININNNNNKSDTLEKSNIITAVQELDYQSSSILPLSNSKTLEINNNCNNFNKFNHYIINRVNNQLNNNNSRFKLINDNNIIELKLNFRDYFNKKNLNNQCLIKKIIQSINKRIKSFPNLKKIYVANRYYPFVSIEEQKQWEIINLIEFNNISTRICYLDKRVSNVKEIQFLYGTVHSVKEVAPFLKSLDMVEQVYLNGDCEGFEYPQLYQLLGNESCFTNTLDFQVETNISIEDFYYILKLSPNTKILLVNLCFDNLIYELSNKKSTCPKCLCTEDDEDKFNEDSDDYNNSIINNEKQVLTISKNNKNINDNNNNNNNNIDNNNIDNNNNNNNNGKINNNDNEQEQSDNSSLINFIKKPKYFKDYWDFIFNFIINHKKLKNIGFSSSCRLKSTALNSKDLPNDFIETFGSMLINNQSLSKVHFNRVPIQFLKLLEYIIQNNKRITRYNCSLLHDSVNNQSKLAQFIKSLNYLLTQKENNHILKFYLESENQIILLNYKKK